MFPWNSLWQRGPQARPQPWLHPSSFINSWHSLWQRGPQARPQPWLRPLEQPMAEALRPAPNLGSAPLALLTLGTAYVREALRPAPSPGFAPSSFYLGHVLAQALF